MSRIIGSISGTRKGSSAPDHAVTPDAFTVDPVLVHIAARQHEEHERKSRVANTAALVANTEAIDRLLRLLTRLTVAA